MRLSVTVADCRTFATPFTTSQTSTTEAAPRPTILSRIWLPGRVSAEGSAVAAWLRRSGKRMLDTY